MNNPYNTLNVKENATEEEIKKAYRKKATEQHPDIGGDEEEFKKSAEAYAIIGNPKKRKQFDETGSTDTEDPLANIHAEVSEMFFNVIERNKGKIQYVNIIKEMIDIVTNAISLAKDELINRDSSISNTEKLLSRITRDDDSENFFDNIIKGRIKHMEYEKLQISNQIEKFNTMIDLIEVYHCSQEQKPERRQQVRSYGMPHDPHLPDWMKS